MLNKYKNIQPIAYKILTNSINENRYNHAYLFETNGYDEALEFIKNFVKEIFKNDNPSNYESLCKKIDNDAYPELRIISPDGLWIKKDQLLDLQSEFKTKPIYSKQKVYIINKANQLNSITANSILKFLEEPQEGIIAILVCNNRYNLMDTIVSRCQVISLNNPNKIDNNDDLYTKIGSLITTTIEEKNVFLSLDKNKEIINGTIDFVKFFEVNGIKILCYINKHWNNFCKSKEDYYIGLYTMLLIYEDFLSQKIGKKGKIFNDLIENTNIINNNSMGQLVNKLNFIYNALEKIKNNSNLNLLMDKLLIEMVGVK